VKAVGIKSAAGAIAINKSISNKKGRFDMFLL
jgi:hypothetical protein